MEVGINPVVYLIVLVFGVGVIAVALYIAMTASPSVPTLPANGNLEQQNQAAPNRRGRRNLRLRRRRNANENDEENEDEENAVEDDEEELNDDEHLEMNDENTAEFESSVAKALAKGKKIGTKKMNKLKMKDERRQQAEQLKEERRRREELQERERQLDQQKREDERKKEQKMYEEIAAQEEERRKKEEEKEKEEYDQWKDSFNVEEEGSNVLSAEEEQKQLQDFIQYIKEVKVCMLDDLAIKYNKKITEVVEWLQKLDADGTLNGIIDDKGKFIYISEEEMNSLVNFINRRGRIHMDDFVAYCNEVVKVANVQSL